MKNLKKLLPISLACTMALSLVACGSDDEPAPTITYTAPVTTTTTPVTPTPEPVVDVVSSATPDFVTLTTPLPSGGYTDVTVPHFPDKIVFLDYMAFDMCATWGVIDALEYMTIQAEMPEELTTFVAEGTVDLSPSISKGDLSLIEEFAPDVIFSTQDLGHLFDELTAIAPTVSYEMDKNVGLFQNLVDISKRNSTIFSVPYLIDPAVADFETRLETLKLYSEQVTTVVLKQDGTTVTPVVDNDEYPLFFYDLGFVNLAEDYDEDTQITYDVLSTLNPDYIFTMDITSSQATPVTLEEVSEILEENQADTEKTEETEATSEEADSEKSEESSETESDKPEESSETESDKTEESSSQENTEATAETAATNETAVALNSKLLEELASWENGKVVTLDAGYWHSVEGGVFAMDVMLLELETAFGLTAENRLVCYRDTQAYQDYWAEKAAKQAAKEEEAAALAAELGLVVEETEEIEETEGTEVDETTTSSDSDKEEATTSSDSDKEETTTSSDSDKEETTTSSDSDKEETTTSSDSDKEETTTSSDSDKEETTTTTTSTTTDYESLEGKITDLEAKIADLESRIAKLLEE